MSRLHKLFLVWLGIVFRSWDLLTTLLFKKVIYKEPKKNLPLIDDLTLLDSATAIAAKIRHQKVSSVEVMKSFIDRIEKINPVLNVVTERNFEAALEEAAKADELVRSGSKSVTELEEEFPFLGVPFTTKVSVAVAGMLHTAGLLVRKDMRATKDSDAVALLRKAGAVPLATTNVSELCMWWESSNLVHGRTSNAYDQNHIVGGSSGGEGCIQSAAASAMGLGADIGGSIRMPSFFNGVFGHKVSTGIIPNRGQEPEAEGELNTFLSTGPIVRYAVDLVPILKVLAGPNAARLQLDKKVDVSKLKFFYMEDDGGFPLMSKVDADIKEAIAKAAKHFESAYNVKAKKISIKQMFHSLEIWAAKMNSVPEAYTWSQELALRQGSVSLVWELCKWLVGLPKHTLPSIALGLQEYFKPDINSPKNQRFLSMCNELKREFQSILGEDGILFYPSHPTSAPFHNQPLCRPFNFAYTAIFNVLGLPVTQVPMGLGETGLPVGIQVVVLTIVAVCAEEVAVEEKTYSKDYAEISTPYGPNGESPYPYGGANRVYCNFKTYNDFSKSYDCRDYKYPIGEGKGRYCNKYNGYCCPYTGECYYEGNWEKAAPYCPYCNKCQCNYPGKPEPFHDSYDQFMYYDKDFQQMNYNGAPGSSY